MTRILVVDEEPLIGEVIAAALEEGGHEVVAVQTEKAALRTVSRPFDVVFVHRGLPDSTCNEIVYGARRHAEPYVVLLSSERSAEAERNKVRLGAAEILYKPLDPLTLRSVVARAEARGEASLEEVPDGPRILVVDDDELVLASVVDILEDRFEVQGTGSPLDALERLRERPYELLITDLLMDEMRGIDLIRAARNARPSMHAIVMTGYASKDTAVAALKQGAFDFLEKPLTPKLVLRAVERAWKALRYELENRKLLAELRRMNQELKAATEVKNRFLASVSHELRTPLHGVLASLSLLRDETTRAEEAPSEGTPSEGTRGKRELLDLATRSGQEMLVLVDNLLDIAEDGPLLLSPQDVSFEAVLGEIAATLQPRAEAAGLAFELLIDPGLPARGHLDPDRLRQVLTHLVGNAVRFTAEGRVRICAESAPQPQQQPEDSFHGASTVRISVEDTGIGIAPEAREAIFDPFVRLGDSPAQAPDRAPGQDRSQDRSQDPPSGPGLGLAHSRRLVEAMGGSLGVDSVPGEGSVFWVVLPAGAPAAEAAEAEQPAQGLRILVAEDDAGNRLVIEKMLEHLGHTVFLVPNGQRAVEFLEQQTVDLVLMDYQMPVLDGCEAARRIRAREGSQPVIIGLSGFALETYRRRCLDAGMDDFLTKPLDLADLAVKLAAWATRSVGRGQSNTPPPAAT